MNYGIIIIGVEAKVESISNYTLRFNLLKYWFRSLKMK